MSEPCCIAAAHGQACTCRRADFWPVNMPRPEPSHDWRELHQDEQPRLSDGYTAIMFMRPGLYHVKGPGPAKHPVPSGDYHEGIEEGWKAGEAQERRVWEEAVKLSFGTIPEGLRNALEQVRAGVEGE